MSPPGVRFDAQIVSNTFIPNLPAVFVPESGDELPGEWQLVTVDFG